MKKAYKITKISFSLALIVILSTFFYGVYSRDRVTIREDILYGDPSRAEGVEVSYYTSIGYKKGYWKNNIKLGKDFSSNSQFKNNVNLKESIEDAEEFYGHALNWIQCSSTDEIDFNDEYSIFKNMDYSMFTELAKECKNESTITKTLCLADYWDYFYFEIGKWNQIDSQDMKKISKYIDIKVPEDYYVECSITKDIEGKIKMVSMKEISDKYNYEYLKVTGVYLDDGIYFIVTLNDKIYENKIFVVPKENEVYKSNKINTIDNIPIIDEGKYFMGNSYDRKFMYLIKSFDNIAYFYKLDKTGQILHEITIPLMTDEQWNNMKVKDGYIIVTSDMSRFLIARDIDNKIKLEMIGNYGFNELSTMLDSTTFYDGDRFVAVVNDDTFDNCTKFVFVHSKEKIEYFGKYIFEIKEKGSSLSLDLKNYGYDEININKV